MNISISPSKARGTAQAPTSKSMAHRLLIVASMCQGESVVRGIPLCDDVLATLECLSALGIRYERTEDTVRVWGRDYRTLSPVSPLPCRESGSTLRFMLPLAVTTGKEVTLTGAKSLFRRPLDVYEALFSGERDLFEKGEDSVRVRADAPDTHLCVSASISSQFITGLLFMLTVLGREARLELTGTVESRCYILLTISALSAFGVRVEWENERTLYLAGGQTLVPSVLDVEGDYSGGAFLEALNYVGGEVEVTGLRPDSLQGDRAYLDYFPMLNQGHATLSIADCPDLGPILFALSAAKHGATFLHTKRLKIKESDRALMMARELSKFGATLAVHEDSVEVIPSPLHAPSEPLSGCGDHRIVMSLAVLCCVYGGVILGAEAVAKSFPDFFEKIKALGIEVTEQWS